MCMNSTVLQSKVTVMYSMYFFLSGVSFTRQHYNLTPPHTHRHPHMFCFPYSYLVITKSIIKVNKVIYDTIKVQISSWAISTVSVNLSPSSLN